MDVTDIGCPLAVCVSAHSLAPVSTVVPLRVEITI